MIELNDKLKEIIRQKINYLIQIFDYNLVKEDNLINVNKIIDIDIGLEINNNTLLDDIKKKINKILENDDFKFAYIREYIFNINDLPFNIYKREVHKYSFKDTITFVQELANKVEINKEKTNNLIESVPTGPILENLIKLINKLKITGRPKYTLTEFNKLKNKVVDNYIVAHFILKISDSFIPIDVAFANKKHNQTRGDKINLKNYIPYYEKEYYYIVKKFKKDKLLKNEVTEFLKKFNTHIQMRTQIFFILKLIGMEVFDENNKTIKLTKNNILYNADKMGIHEKDLYLISKKIENIMNNEAKKFLYKIIKKTKFRPINFGLLK